MGPQARNRTRRTGLHGVVVLVAAQGEDEQSVAQGVDAEPNEGHGCAAVRGVGRLQASQDSFIEANTTCLNYGVAPRSANNNMNFAGGGCKSARNCMNFAANGP